MRMASDCSHHVIGFVVGAMVDMVELVFIAYVIEINTNLVIFILCYWNNILFSGLWLGVSL
ncbi:hypothetical protein QE369_000001 [Agrobacterium larrymoorei]|uniref:Uncharacterized protein n=1 Tax=Agrobacterium larrymoorei TaxID=160699 RepID=A0AAJ2B3U0_9HYPH|nr:hypothetical protein [Agrobacterium larrymoorei]